MASRLSLQTLLENILGSRNVYYQPPSSVHMKYPAIVYFRNDIKNTFADDITYMQAHKYEVTVIDKNPDSEIVDIVSKLPTCIFNRRFESDNLNHTVFILNY